MKLNPFLPPNARFWVWWQDGPVKLTLLPGQALTAHHYARHDEGWSSHTETYSHEGDLVKRETHDDGRDCDGRLTQVWVDVAPLDRLQACPICLSFEPEIPATHLGRPCCRPDWQEQSARQRDEFAEAMGY